MNALSGRVASTIVMTVGIALAGCSNEPRRNVDEGYGHRDGRCQSCGVVQDVRQINPGGAGASGVVIGDAVVAGVPGGEVGDQHAGAAWRIVVRLDNGQYASVTRRESSGIRNGDYVEVRDGLVYAR
jgi:outer membrane lipoprotein SlyB